MCFSIQKSSYAFQLHAYFRDNNHNFKLLLCISLFMLYSLRALRLCFVAKNVCTYLFYRYWGWADRSYKVTELDAEKKSVVVSDKVMYGIRKGMDIFLFKDVFPI